MSYYNNDHEKAIEKMFVITLIAVGFIALIALCRVLITGLP